MPSPEGVTEAALAGPKALSLSAFLGVGLRDIHAGGSTAAEETGARANGRPPTVDGPGNRLKGPGSHVTLSACQSPVLAPYRLSVGPSLPRPSGWAAVP